MWWSVQQRGTSQPVEKKLMNTTVVFTSDSQTRKCALECPQTSQISINQAGLYGFVGAILRMERRKGRRINVGVNRTFSWAALRFILLLYLVEVI